MSPVGLPPFVRIEAATTLINEKGPAEAATSPSHGSTNPEKGQEMNVHTDSTPAPDGQMPAETRDVGDAIDIIARAISIAELLHMAGNSLWHDHRMSEGGAIMTAVGILDDMLTDAKAILYANLEKGGAA